MDTLSTGFGQVTLPFGLCFLIWALIFYSDLHIQLKHGVSPDLGAPFLERGMRNLDRTHLEFQKGSWEPVKEWIRRLQVVIPPPVLTCSFCPGLTFGPHLFSQAPGGLQGLVGSGLVLKDLHSRHEEAESRPWIRGANSAWLGVPLSWPSLPYVPGMLGVNAVPSLSVIQSSWVFSGIYYIPNGLYLQFGVLQESNSNFKEDFLNFKAVERIKFLQD